MSEGMGNIMDIILGAGATFLTGIGLYNVRKIHEFPEKYTSKTDFVKFREEIREDLKNTKYEIRDDMKENTHLILGQMEGGINRLYEYIQESSKTKT